MNKQIRYKSFLKLLSIIISSFLLYHSVIWNFYTSKIFGREDGLYVGDIGRMSYQIDSLQPRKLEYTLNKKILNHKKYNNQAIDILTIGDSFSNAAVGGLNPYYQDFIATEYNKNILNLQRIQNGQHTIFELVIILYNNGWLQKHKPKAIIIESAQRGVYERFAKEFDFSYTNNTNIDIQMAKTKDSYIPNLLMINTANYKLPFYTLKYKFKNRAFKDVVKLKLKKDLFTTKDYASTLLFHYSDITSIDNSTSKVAKINANFNKLAKLLKPLGIKLYFMPVVDKYDLYSDYIIDNPYPKNHFFDIIQPMKREYYLINTKKILSPMLQDGIKDLYYCDDTHWSYKASKEISKKVKF